jgi:hypothetical protein
MAKINIAVDTSVTYERFITGQGGIAPIDQKDTVVVLTFKMPDSNVVKLQFGEYHDSGYPRWIVTTGPKNPFPVTGQQTGTLNFTRGAPSPGTNEMETPVGTPVVVTVYQYDPALPPPAPKEPKGRNMVFDWSKQ